MPYEPVIVEREEQPYAAIRGRVRTDGFAVLADRVPELFGWLAARGTEPVGGPFFRYDLLGAAGECEVEAGIPVAVAPTPEGDVLSGVLLAGRYATVTHFGHPDGLAEAASALLAWAAVEGLEWDMTATQDGERWGARLETYRTDPRVRPDPREWETELAFRLAG
ncbi:GyrI-like domain-containing protein [Streptomyces sp. CA-294286]|uniref:GyrI-like domain-containing protein n=1 Tax=Streptomyces sp. CA-294286 TaxID=3240070 RepID=UPI003D91B500